MPISIFETRLHSLPQAQIDLERAPREKEDQFKKRCRIDISAQHTSEVLGFLHACLIDTPAGSILLAGKSGSGKSTLAEQVVKQVKGARIAGNDWIAVERNGDDYFASDLNHQGKVIHTNRSLIAGIIFLGEADLSKRDAFYPSQEEFGELLLSAFDAMETSQAATLSKFWLSNYTNLPFVSAIPNVGKTEAESLDIILDILWRYEKFATTATELRVGVVGIGAVGSTLAYQLGHNKHISTVNLFNRRYERARAVALDLNHAAGIDIFCHYNAFHDLETVFQQSDVVFVALRDAGPKDPSLAHLPERLQKLPVHAKALEAIAKAASDTQFRGVIYVITNPSDILAHALWKKSQNCERPLKNYQVFGLGMELDRARAFYYMRQGDQKPELDSIAVYGDHCTTMLATYKSEPVSEDLLAQVRTASESVRTGGGDVRTIFGPTKAFVRNLEALIDHAPTSITIVEGDSYVGGEVTFSGGLSSSFIHPEAAGLLEGHRGELANYRNLM